MQNHVLDYLDASAKRIPKKNAFCGENDALTFEALARAVAGIGTFIGAKGYRRTPIIVCMEKGPSCVAALFGVIASGNFYVPIDREMPKARCQMIFENVNAPMLLCDTTTKEYCETLGAENATIVCYEDVFSTQADDALLQDIRAHAIDTDPLYVVFTSGSTGVPKGVVGCHRAVIDYIEQLSDVLGFSEDTVFGNQTPLYLDACFKELFPTIKFGATTHFVPKPLFMMPLKLVEFLNERKVNTICWVVSALTMISTFGTFKTMKPEYLHTVAFGSEVFPPKQLKIWRETLPNATFTNLYGPTEGTGMCCYYHVTRDFAPEESIPIGGPFKNTEIILLNEKNERCLTETDGQGEICIRGTSLTLGYINNPEKTAECFVQNPLQTMVPELIYRTGDLAHYNADGELIFVSRKDYQIKHMGHRIELGEIEAAAQMQDEISQAVCLYDAPRKKIKLYYVGAMSAQDLKIALQESLPRYMVPNQCIAIDRIPLTPNGKIDRITLAAM